MTFDLYVDGQIYRRAVSLDWAAEISQLDSTEIEWAIEEFGRCDALFDNNSREMTIVAHENEEQL